ncbi:hypothetical protein NQ315_001509 [Exocentrus adspersus]|uniref:Uncharacterized protein n=1 Tax=Exocentrus adspersus TaxID=1586481 RepID=A0AAV8W8Z4_9CUCU|nr:hypothetical protein NQ315_001509 [Exocentrus adspersus]
MGYRAISDLDSPIFKVDLKSVQTNILIMRLEGTGIVARDFQQRIAEVKDDDPVKVSVRASSRDSNFVRFVTYWEITDEDVDVAIQKIVFVIKELENKSSK